MSNHFTGLKLGPPLGDPRLDLTELYVFPAPADPTRTVLILNANTFAEASAFHPDAVYRINIDNDGDTETDMAVSIVFSEPADSRQRATVFLARGEEACSPEAVGDPIFSDAEVSFGPEPAIAESGPYRFFAGLRSDAFFVDFEGVLNLFDYEGGKNFTVRSGDTKPSPWTGTDRLADENVFAMVLELPTSELGGDPAVRVWGRVSVRRGDELVHADRAGHPTVSSFFNTDDTKEEYNAAEPAQDRQRFMEQFVHVLGHTGDYSPEEARAAIDRDGLLPDMLSFDPSQPPGYPNGRQLTDHVVAHRLAFISKGEIPPDGLEPHTDLLEDFPYLGTPHAPSGAAT
jgi:Domain of unknown function (DUF4331)